MGTKHLSGMVVSHNKRHHIYHAVAVSHLLLRLQFPLQCLGQLYVGPVFAGLHLAREAVLVSGWIDEFSIGRDPSPPIILAHEEIVELCRAQRSQLLSAPLIHPCDDWSEITQLLIININHQATDCWVPKKWMFTKKTGVGSIVPIGFHDDWMIWGTPVTKRTRLRSVPRGYFHFEIYRWYIPSISHIKYD